MLVNTYFTSHSSHFVLAVTVRKVNLYSHGNFWVCNTTFFTMVTIMCFSPELIHRITEHLYALINIFPFILQPLAITILLFVSLSLMFLDSIYVRSHIWCLWSHIWCLWSQTHIWCLSFHVWLISLGVMPSRSIHVVSNGGIFLFFNVG